MSDKVLQEHIVRVSKKIEQLVESLNISYIEACVIYSEENDVDIEQLADLLKRNQNIKVKIQTEAEDLHFIKRSPRLQFS